MPTAPPLRQDIVAFDRTRAAFESVKRRGRDLQRTFGRNLLTGLGVGLATNLINPLGRATEALEEFDALGKRIRTTGFSSDFYQTLQLAVEEASVDQERFNHATERFVAVIGEAKTGRGEFVETLRRSHGELVREVQTARNTDEAFRAIAESVARAQSAEEKALITKSAFGSRMIGLTRVLNLGAEGFARTEEKARALGLIIDQEMLDNAEKLQNEYDVASDVIKTNFQKALVDLSPVIVRSTQGIASMASTLSDDLSGGLGRVSRRFGAMSIEVEGFTSAWKRFKDLDIAGAIDEINRSQARARRFIFNDQFAGITDTGFVPEHVRRNIEQVGDAAEDGFGRVRREAVKLDTTTKSNIIEPMREAQRQAQAFGDGVAGAFDRAVFSGERLGDIAKDLGRSFLRSGISALADSIFRGPGGSAGKGLFGGFRAGGGPVSPGKAFMVGERGPELFVPNRAGTIVPNGAAGGTTVIQNFNIDARGAQAGVAEQLHALLPGVTRQASRQAVAEVLFNMRNRPGFGRK